MSGENFSGYILAGGKSSRMGCDKALLEIDGEIFLKRAVRILKSADVSQTGIVLSPRQKDFAARISTDSEFVFDSFENRGALGGIHAALKNCQTEFAVILAIDLPFVGKSTVEKLMKIACLEKNCAVVVPRQTDGRLQPLCAVYRVADCLLRIEELLLHGKSYSVRAFLNSVAVKIIEENSLRENRNLFLNVNTPADYANLKTAE